MSKGRGRTADVTTFVRDAGDKFSSWETALHSLPHETVDQQLFLGRCFDEFKSFFSGTRGWQLFFIRNSEREEDERQLSERSIGAMISASRLFDWAEGEPDAEHLQRLISEMMQRGQNYGMLGLAAIESLPKRYWRRGVTELSSIGQTNRSRAQYQNRERTWRLATLGEDVLHALAELERPSRSAKEMVSEPSGYDRIVADAIQKRFGDEKRIATVTVRNVMEYLGADLQELEQKVGQVKCNLVKATAQEDPDLANISRIMSLPEEERKKTLQEVARGITEHLRSKGILGEGD